MVSPEKLSLRALYRTKAVKTEQYLISDVLGTKFLQNFLVIVNDLAGKWIGI